MSEHRYPMGALVSDYARAGAGVLLTGGPLVLLPFNLYVTALLGILTALFLAFAGSTYLRQRCRVELDRETIAASGFFPVRLSWSAIEGVRLRYFATRRDRKNGWMELTLRGAGRRVRLDSRIDDFPSIARRAAEVARERHLGLTPTTVANFAALGIEFGPQAGE